MKLRTILLLALEAAAFYSCGSPVFAAESTEDKTSDTSEFDRSGYLGFDTGDFYGETQSLFSTLKEGHEDLQSSYGSLSPVSGEEVYMDYLANLQQANDDQDFDKKLSLIASSDISLNDANLAAAFNKAKGQISNSLAGDGMQINGTVSDEQKQTQNTNDQSRTQMLTTSDSSAKYRKLVEDFQNSGESASTYSGAVIADLGSIMNTSIQGTNHFLTTKSLYQSLTSTQDIASIQAQYNSSSPESFLKKSQTVIRKWESDMTEDGEPLTEKQQSSYNDVQKSLEELEQAINDGNNSVTAAKMSEVRDFLSGHKLSLPEDDTEDSKDDEETPADSTTNQKLGTARGSSDE